MSGSWTYRPISERRLRDRVARAESAERARRHAAAGHRGLALEAFDDAEDDPLARGEAYRRRLMAGRIATGLGGAPEPDLPREGGPEDDQEPLARFLRGAGDVIGRGLRAQGVPGLDQITSVLEDLNRPRGAALGALTADDPAESARQLVEGWMQPERFSASDLGFARHLPEGSLGRRAVGFGLGEAVDPLNILTAGAGKFATRGPAVVRALAEPIFSGPFGRRLAGEVGISSAAQAGAEAARPLTEGLPREVQPVASLGAGLATAGGSLGALRAADAAIGAAATPRGEFALDPDSAPQAMRETLAPDLTVAQQSRVRTIDNALDKDFGDVVDEVRSDREGATTRFMFDRAVGQDMRIIAQHAADLFPYLGEIPVLPGRRLGPGVAGEFNGRDIRLAGRPELPGETRTQADETLARITPEATFLHELGHLVMAAEYQNNHSVRNLLLDAYRGTEYGGTPQHQAPFHEWYANQVGFYLTHPASFDAKTGGFFRRLADRIRLLFARVTESLGYAYAGEAGLELDDQFRRYADDLVKRAQAGELWLEDGIGPRGASPVPVVPRFMQEDPPLGQRGARQQGMSEFGMGDRPVTEGPLEEQGGLAGMPDEDLAPGPLPGQIDMLSGDVIGEPPAARATSAEPDLAVDPLAEGAASEFDAPPAADDPRFRGRAGEPEAEAESEITPAGPAEPPDAGSTPAAPATPGLTPLADVGNVPIDTIRVDPDRFQFREGGVDPRNVQRIVDEFDERMLDPLQVWRDPESGELFLLSGHHRLEALRQMGREQVPVRIFEGDEAAAIDAATRANMRDAQTTLLDEMKSFRYSAEQGKTAAEIAKPAGRRQSYVEQVLALDRLGLQAARIVDQSPAWLPVAARYARFIDVAPEHAREAFAPRVANRFIEFRENYEGGGVPAVAAVDENLALVRELFESQPGIFDITEHTMFGAEMADPFVLASQHFRMIEDMRRAERRFKSQMKVIEEGAEAAGVADESAVATMRAHFESEITAMREQIAEERTAVTARAQAAADRSPDTPDEGGVGDSPEPEEVPASPPPDTDVPEVVAEEIAPVIIEASAAAATVAARTGDAELAREMFNGAAPPSAIARAADEGAAPPEQPPGSPPRGEEEPEERRGQPGFTAADAAHDRHSLTLIDQSGPNLFDRLAEGLPEGSPKRAPTSLAGRALRSGTGYAFNPSVSLPRMLHVAFVASQEAYVRVADGASRVARGLNPVVERLEARPPEFIGDGEPPAIAGELIDIGDSAADYNLSPELREAMEALHESMNAFREATNEVWGTDIGRFEREGQVLYLPSVERVGARKREDVIEDVVARIRSVAGDSPLRSRTFDTHRERLAHELANNPGFVMETDPYKLLDVWTEAYARAASEAVFRRSINRSVAAAVNEHVRPLVDQLDRPAAPLSVREAATALGRAPATIRAMINDGRLRATQTGPQRGATREYRIDPESFHEAAVEKVRREGRVPILKEHGLPMTRDEALRAYHPDRWTAWQATQRRYNAATGNLERAIDEGADAAQLEELREVLAAAKLERDGLNQLIRNSKLGGRRFNPVTEMWHVDREHTRIAKLWQTTYPGGAPGMLAFAADFWRGFVLTADLSLLTIHGLMAALGDPRGIANALGASTRERGITGMPDSVRAIRDPQIYEAILAAKPELMARWQAAGGPRLRGRETEFDPVGIEVLPGIGPKVRGMNDALLRGVNLWSMSLFEKYSARLAQLYPDLDPRVIDAEANAVQRTIVPRMSLAQTGRSRRRSGTERAFLTSPSFVFQPAVMTAMAARGAAGLAGKHLLGDEKAILAATERAFAKLLGSNVADSQAWNTLRPRDRLALERFAFLGATVAGISVTSAILSAEANNQSIPDAVAEVMNPRSGRFLSIILGDEGSIPLGGPFRSLMRLFLPPYSKGVWSWPERELSAFLRSKQAPGIRVVTDFIRGQDYFGRPIDQYFGEGAGARLVNRLFYATASSSPIAVQEAALGTAEGRRPGSIVRNTAFQLAGVNFYERRGSEELDRIARSITIKGPEGRDFHELRRDEQQWVRDHHPETWALAVSQRSEQSQDYEELKQFTLEEQRVSDQRLRLGEITPAEWVEHRRDRQLGLRAQAEAVFGKSEWSEADRDRLVGSDLHRAYIATISLAERGDGTVDWTEVERWRDSLTPEQRTSIDEQSGVGGTILSRVHRDLEPLRKQYLDLPQYVIPDTGLPAAKQADLSRAVNDLVAHLSARVPRELRGNARRAVLVDRVWPTFPVSELRRIAAEYDVPAEQLERAGALYITGGLRENKAREDFRRNNPDYELFFGGRPLTPDQRARLDELYREKIGELRRE